MAHIDADRQAIRSKLDTVAAHAAADPAVPSVLACVSAPELELEWCTALEGTLGSDTPCSADSPFRLASVTKLHTAAAVLRMVEVGGLQLHDPIGRHLGSTSTHLLKAGGHDPTSITVAHLLCHTSGLPDHAALQSYAEAVLESPRRHWTRADQLSVALTMPPTCQAPGLVCLYRRADAGATAAHFGPCRSEHRQS
jgi:D-alanyl-D-alanine carboxypeptidase